MPGSRFHAGWSVSLKPKRLRIRSNRSASARATSRSRSFSPEAERAIDSLLFQWQ